MTTDFYLQIDSHLLAFGGVLLVFLTGCAFVALAVMAFACTVLAAAAAFGIISRGWRLLRDALRFIRHRLRSDRRSKGSGVPLSMEEALRQVATGKTAAVQGHPAKAAQAETSTMVAGKKPPAPAGPVPTGPGSRPPRMGRDPRNLVRKSPLRG